MSHAQCRLAWLGEVAILALVGCPKEEKTYEHTLKVKLRLGANDTSLIKGVKIVMSAPVGSTFELLTESEEVQQTNVGVTYLVKATDDDGDGTIDYRVRVLNPPNPFVNKAFDFVLRSDEKGARAVRVRCATLLESGTVLDSTEYIESDDDGRPLALDGKREVTCNMPCRAGVSCGAGDQPPCLAEPGTRKAKAGAPFVFGVSASDFEGAVNVKARIRSSAGIAAADEVLGASGGGAFGAAFSGTALTWASPTVDGQPYYVDFTATDSAGQVVTKTLKIEVTNDNASPKLDAPLSCGGYKVKETQELRIPLGATDSDGDAVVSTVELLGTWQPSNARIDTSVTPPVFTFTPDNSFARAEPYKAKIVFDDARGGLFEEPIEIVVEDTNRAVKCDTLSDNAPSIKATNLQTCFSVAKNDPDGDVLALTADLSPFPIGVVATLDSTRQQVCFNAVDDLVRDAPYEIGVTYDDAKPDGKVTCTFKVTLTKDNDSPVLTAPLNTSAFVTAGKPLSIDVSATDANNDAMTYAYSCDAPLGADITFESMTGGRKFQWATKFSEQREQPYTCSFSATDGKSPPVKTDVSIVVLPPAPGSVGSPCSDTNSCDLGLYCADGVCCDKACDETCEACNVQGYKGECRAVPAGRQRVRGGVNDCGGANPAEACLSGACDGSRGCTRLVEATKCRDGSCSEGNRFAAAAYCGASGLCPAASAVACAEGFACASTLACKVAPCAVDADCASGMWCQGGECVGQRDLGVACTADHGAECKSGNCVNATCCASASCAAGKTCANLGNNAGGTCKWDKGQSASNVNDCATSYLTLGRCCTQAACGIGEDCETGVCKKNLGYACSAEGDCKSSACMDGRCCVIASRPSDAHTCANANGAWRFKEGQTCAANGACSSDVCAPPATGEATTCCDRACDLGAGYECRTGKCLLVNAKVCGASASCQSGACVKDSAGAATGYCCAVGACAGDGSETCKTGVCRKKLGRTCAADSECVSGLCAVEEGSTVAYCCASALCTAGYTCASGRCEKKNADPPPPPPSGTTCQLDGDCTGGKGCVNGFCCDASFNAWTCAAGTQPVDCGVCKKVKGATCQGSADCASGYCVSGASGNICCDRRCDGMCEACDASNGGTAGTCHVAAAGTDPGGKCAPYSCNGVDQDCRARCSANAECTGIGTSCVGGKCVQELGRRCTETDQCKSGNCVDNACCGTSSCPSGSRCGTNETQSVIGQCLALAGQACAVATNGCQSTVCRDAKCCATACDAATLGTGVVAAPLVEQVTCDNTAGNCRLLPGSVCGVGAGASAKACNAATCQPAGSVAGVVAETVVAVSRCCAATCGATEFCDGSGVCRKRNGQSASASSECHSGNRVDGTCCETSTCPAGETCANASGTCKKLQGETCGAQGAHGCTDALTCVDGRCCNSASCAANTVCSNAAGVCKKVNGQTASNASECNSGNRVDGRCCASASCGAGYTCDNGAGTCKLANGQSCGTNGALCNSGFCADGVCCESACAGASATCRACNVAGSEGTCAPVANGSDPKEQCGDYVCATTPTTAACAAICGGSGAGQCDLATAVCETNGQCRKKYGQSCGTDGAVCQFTVGGAAGACVDGRCCKGACATGSTCINADKVCRKLNGQTCSSAAECNTGNCVDGFCCDGACSGVCESCAVPGLFGTCSATGASDEAACGAFKCAAGARVCRTTCGSASDCKADTLCSSGACYFRNGQSCSVGPQCFSGACVESTCCASTSCTADKTCANASGICKKRNGQPATGPSECNSGNVVNSTCCVIASCGTNETCANGGGTCKKVNGQTASSAGECNSENLVNGTCCATASCGANESCANAAGSCKKVNGQACGGANECKSGNCVDGFCCASACSGAPGTCRACNVAGSEGTCAPVANGTDVKNNCGDYVCATTATTAACATSCTGDGTGKCDLTVAMCETNGQCRKKYGQSCGSDSAVCQFTVGGTAGSCEGDKCCKGVCSPGTTSCANADNECRKVNGLACASGADCNSGFCADGVCCNGACGGACESCVMPGLFGTCSPTAAVDESACGPYKCATSTRACQTTCSSSTNCKTGASCSYPSCKYNNGYPCSSGLQCYYGYCVNGTCCNSSSCTPDRTCANSSGTCKLRNGQATSVASNCNSGFLVGGRCCEASSCAENFSCGNAEGVCKKTNGQAAAAASECNSGNLVDGTCCSTATCGAGERCSNAAGVCLKANGVMCGAASECNSAFCVDGVCCESACSGADGLCRACNVAGALGQCAPVANGSDPKDNCAAYQCATLQSPVGCATSCTGDGTLQCDLGVAICEEGLCRKKFGETCGDASECRYRAETTAGSCVTGRCCQAASCGAGSDCNNADGVCKKSNGQACVATSECSSGFCKDGVCCNEACTGACEQCDKGGSEGTCSASGALDDSRCGPWKCKASERACEGPTCTVSSQCNTNATCSWKPFPTTLKCVFNLGMPCTDSAACGTACTDGVCCSVADCGECKVCATNGSSCTPVAYGQNKPGASACAAMSGDATCGTGMCDGAGACTGAGKDLTCNDGDGTTAPDTCDGAGGCAGRRWSFLTPTPTSESANGCWAASATDLFCVFNDGFIFRHDGTTWTSMASPTRQNLVSISGASASRIFAVGDRGTLIEWNGTAWSAVNTGMLEDLRAVSVAASGSVAYALGKGATLLTYNGTTWTRSTFAPTVATLNAVWTDGTTAMVARDDGRFHFKSSAPGSTCPDWCLRSTNQLGALTGIWGADASNIFVKTTASRSLRRYDGITDTWLEQLSVGGAFEAQVFHGVSAAELYVGYTNYASWDNNRYQYYSRYIGKLVRYQNGAWGLSYHELRFTADVGSFRFIHAANDSNIFFSGAASAKWGIVRRATAGAFGTSGSGGPDVPAALPGFSIDQAPVGGVFWALAANDLFQAVGLVVPENSTNVYKTRIMHFNGSTWTNLMEFSRGNPGAIWGTGTTDNLTIFVGASGGNIHKGVRTNGTWTWTTESSERADSFIGIWGSSATDVYAIGSSTLYHYNGTVGSCGLGWCIETVKIGGTTIYGIWGLNAANVYVSTTDGIRKRSIDADGVPAWWLFASAPYSGAKIWGTATNDIFTSTANSEVRHYDGTIWTTTFQFPESPVWPYLRARVNSVHGIKTDTKYIVYMTGSDGSIRRWTGTRWTHPEAVGTSVDLRAFVDPAGGVWATGANVLLYRTPTP